MLVDVFISILNWILELTFDFLPKWSLPSFVVDAFTTGVLWVSRITEILPFVKSLVIGVSVLILFHLTIKIANIAIGTMALLRGSGKPNL